MQHFIVGSLLLIIIAAAGWLIVFNTRMLNIKALADDNLRVLKMHIRKKSKTINNFTDDSSSIALKLEQLEARIDEYLHFYNDNVYNYNKLLARFPNNIAGKILGLRKLSLFQVDNTHSDDIEASSEKS